MRIALVSPYSWTYPGGVTRHIEALAAELAADGHEPRIIAPFDPDDRLSVRLHKGARPQRHPAPDGFVSLGRTVGIPANGAVSNLSVTPHAIATLRRELRAGGYDVAHIHEPVVPVISWDALCSAGELPLAGTFHTYSENALTNGVAAVPLGGRRRMNRLHARIAVSEAAAWTARRFFGGSYRIIPNGVHLQAPPERWSSQGGELRILFIGQAVQRKGLPVLLAAFEALREHVPVTLTLVGASRDEVAHMTLEESGIEALGKVSEEEKLRRLREADVLCAPSLNGESFGMVLTEAFAAATPVIASDIPGYRDVVRDGQDGVLTPPGDPLALAECLRAMALDVAGRERMARSARERAERFAWPHVASEALDSYEQAIATARRAQAGGGALVRTARRYGLAPRDLLVPEPAQRLPSLQPARPKQPLSASARRLRTLRRAGLAASSLAGVGLAALALEHVGVTRVAASLLASKPGLVAAGLALMCAAMFARALSWHAILAAAPTWRRAKRRDAMQGTFIGVLMSSTLPARLGEPSRALVVARRLGRTRETLPVVLGTMVSQTLLNLLALSVLGIVTLSRVSVLEGHDRDLMALALTPLAALLVVLAAPLLVPPAAVSRFRRLQGALVGLRGALLRLRRGLSVFRDPRAASRDARPARRVGAAVAVLLAAADGARARRARRRRRSRRGAVRRQRHRGDPGHPRQRRRLPGRLRRGAERRLPRLDARRDRLRDRAAGRRGRDRADHGPAGAAQRGSLLARGAAAHHARHARSPAAPGARPRGRRSRLRGARRRERRVRTGRAAAMGEAWVYMLRCRDGSLYTGWSTDVQRRLASHRAGRASRYTASRLPVELVMARAMDDRGAAMREEARIKRLDRAAKLALIAGTTATG